MLVADRIPVPRRAEDHPRNISWFNEDSGNRSIMIREKLDAYRRQKRKEEMIETMRNTLQIILPWSGSRTSDEPPTEVALLKEREDVQDTESTCSDDSVNDSQCTMVTIVLYLLYFLLWATLYVIAIKFEFGAVYFVLSMLISIFLNTHSRPKKHGELSAYSVFNPNCEAIDGTLDVSQFESEIRYGLGTVR